MSDELAARVLLGAVSCAVLFWFLCVELRKSTTAYFRTLLYAVRDDAFALFATKGIAHNHPAHMMIRNIINGAIDDADLLNPIGFVILASATPRDRSVGASCRQAMSDAIASLPDREMRDQVSGFHTRVTTIIVLFIAFGSLLGVLCSVIFLGRAIIKKIIAELGRRTPPSVRDQIYQHGIEPIECRAQMRGSVYAPSAA